LHFLVYKLGFKTVTSQIYSPDDPHLETDSQFGVTRALLGNFVAHQNEPAPNPEVTGTWYSLQHIFVLQRGESWLPTPPVTAKASGRIQSGASNSPSKT
jgi:catechol 1,2-dioxygenase